MKRLSLLLLLALFSCTQDPVMFNITVTTSEGGEVSLLSGSYEEGSSVTITATPSAEYLFTGWSNGSTDNPLVLTVTSDLTIQASFTKKQYELTISKEGEGAVSEKVINTGKGYDSGTKVELTAVPAGEWVFAGWSGDITSNDNPLQVTISSPKNIKAKFVKRKYPLTVNIEGQGTVTEEVVSTGKTTEYDSGTTVRLTAQASEGWEFTGWTGELSGNNNTQQLFINNTKVVGAIFQKLIVESLSVENPPETIIVSHKFSPIVFANYKNGQKLDVSSYVKISSVNKKTTILSDNTIVGAIKGNEKLIFDYQEQSTSLEIFINNIEFEILDSKFLEFKESTINVPFIMINIFPTNDGIIHNDTLGPSSYWQIDNPLLEKSKSKIKNILITSKNAIELGTSFRDYGKNQVKPYITLMPLAYINIYISKDNEYKTKRTWNNRRTFDYKKMFLDLDIESYVNTKGLKEIWITDFSYGGYPSLVNSGLYVEGNDDWLPESNMSSPLTGDISNSYRIPDDLPIYKNTFIVYGNSGHRGVDTNIHNRGHQIESQFRHIEKNKISGQELFWNKFVGVVNGNQSLNKRAGNTHFPPNATSDYDYCNQNSIESDLFNWTPQGGVKQIVNCSTWRDLSLNFTYNKYSDEGIHNINNDPHTKWLITWFQSIPGQNNKIPYNKDGQEHILTNWWDIFFNWDEAISENKTLWE